MFKQLETRRQQFMLVAFLCSLFLVDSPVFASVSTTIDFNTLPNGNTAPHGLIINDQYASQGLTVSADNVGGGPDITVAFDTTLTSTRDPDLEDPFTTGNLAPTSDLGNVLIIQENNSGTGDGVADRPDDEGSRPAGSIFFDFAVPITEIGFDLIDIEATEVLGSYFASFFTSGDSMPFATVNFNEFLRENDRTDLTDDEENDAVNDDGFFSIQSEGDVKFTGDNSANRIDPITVEDLRMFTGNSSIEDFTRVVIRFGGSGAIDNLSFSSAALVPEAASLLTWVLLGVSACLSRKRA